jgi:hypothetical protein
MSWSSQQGDKNEEFEMGWWDYPDASGGSDFLFQCHWLLHTCGNHPADRWGSARGNRKEEGGLTVDPGSKINQDIEWVYSIFPRLEERMHQRSGTLSGGEQQMLAVGRALVSGRKVMLLDEPSMGLAPLLMIDVFKVLTEINKQGTTILLVEQNARMALQFAQRGYVLESGNLVVEGDSKQLLDDPEVKKAYLGGWKFSGLLNNSIHAAHDECSSWAVFFCVSPIESWTASNNRHTWIVISMSVLCDKKSPELPFFNPFFRDFSPPPGLEMTIDCGSSMEIHQ